MRRVKYEPSAVITITCEEAMAGCQKYIQLPGLAAALRINLSPGIRDGARLKINNAKFYGSNGGIEIRPLNVTIRVFGKPGANQREFSYTGTGGHMGVRKRRYWWIPVVAVLAIVCIILLVSKLGAVNPIVGQWQALSSTPNGFPNAMELFKDGTCIAEGEAGGTYSFEDNRLMLDLGAWFGSHVYSCKISGDQLTLSAAGEDITYYRANVRALSKPMDCPYSLPENAVRGDARVVSSNMLKDDDGIYHTDFTVEKTIAYNYADLVEIYAVRCSFYTSAGQWYVGNKDETGYRIDWNTDFVGKWSGSNSQDDLAEVNIISFSEDSIQLSYTLDSYNMDFEGSGSFALGTATEQSYRIDTFQTIIPTYSVLLESETIDGWEVYLKIDICPNSLALSFIEPYDYFGKSITMHYDG